MIAVMYHISFKINTKFIPMKPACKDLHNKDMDIHAGSMAEVTETNELHTIITLK